MFTGIVTEVGRVASILPNTLSVNAQQVMKGLELGGSVAVNGACLTVTSFTSDTFTVGVTPETLHRTNLGMLKAGSPVNLERPLGVGGELGGHIVQGHVDCTGKIVSITPVAGGNAVYRFQCSPDIMRYVVEKGFIALDGMSLTITARGEDYFEISVIEYTRRHTNLIYRKVGDPVNLEVDILAKYVEQFLQGRRSNLTLEFLRENGF